MKILLLGFILMTPLMAMENPALLDAKNQKNQASDSKEAILDQLFSALGYGEEFDTALKKAKQAGIHPQVILEARFLNLVDLGDHAAIAAMLPELIERRDSFNPDHSEVFAIKDDWLAIIHYAQALAALEKNDESGFKKHITDAFYLSPRQAPVFSPHIEKFRLGKAMQSLSFPLQKSLQSQSNGKSIALSQLMKGNKAIILYFWSPMSRDIQVNLPDFIITSKACHANNMPVLAILTGKYPEMLQDAEMLRKEDASQAQCTWLMDSNKDSLASLLHVKDLPTMVIVSPEGKILFNGQPSDDAFWATLKKISPEFKKPNRSNNVFDE